MNIFYEYQYMNVKKQNVRSIKPQKTRTISTDINNLELHNLYLKSMPLSNKNKKKMLILSKKNVTPDNLNIVFESFALLFKVYRFK